MIRLILLAASGALLLCQTMAYSSIPWEMGPRHVGATPCSGETCQSGGSYPAPEPQYQQDPYAQPQYQPGAYPIYQPAPAVPSQPEPYPYYQPTPAVQPQVQPYPYYQPAPAIQPQVEPYPYYPQASAVQPQAEPYPYYQPAPAIQPQVEPYPYYPQASAVQPQAEPYSYYPNPSYYPTPGIQPQPYNAPQYVQPNQMNALSYYPPSPPMPEPSQPNMIVRYIPGVVSRKYTCRQSMNCGWTSQTTPGRYISIWVPAPVTPGIQTCYPQPQCYNTQQPCTPLRQYIYPPAPPPVYPPTPCVGHSYCGGYQQCCYDPSRATMLCSPGASVAIRNQRHLQLNNTATVTSRSHVELVITDWRNSDVTSFVTDLLLPLKVDLEHDMEVILRTDPEQNDRPCDSQDADCIGLRILSCVAEMWPSVIQPLAVAGSAPINTPFPPNSPSGPLGEHPKAGLVEPLGNTNNDIANRSEDSSSFDLPDFSEGDTLEVVVVDPLSSAAHARQVRLLSFTACLLQSFGAGTTERKKTALLAAKRCVRAYKLQWPLVRACVARRGQGVMREVSEQVPPHTRPMEIYVNGEPAPDLDNFKLALCQALLETGQAPLLCDLVYDELDQQQEEQNLANTEAGNPDTLSIENQDSPSLRHTNSQGLGKGWSDQGLGFSHSLPWNQTQGGADRPLEGYGTLEAKETQESYRTL